MREQIRLITVLAVRNLFCHLQVDLTYPVQSRVSEWSIMH